MNEKPLHRDWNRFASDIASAAGDLLGAAVNLSGLNNALNQIKRQRANPEKAQELEMFVWLRCGNCGRNMAHNVYEAYQKLYDAYLILTQQRREPSGSLGKCKGCQHPLDPHILYYDGRIETS